MSRPTLGNPCSRHGADDVCPECIRRTREALKDIRARLGDILAMPEPPESGDIVDRCYQHGAQLLARQVKRMLRGVPK